MAPKNEQLSAAEKAEIMGDGFSLAHQQEAQERYGKTDDWAEYQRRTATMNRADWQNGKQQVDAGRASPRRGFQLAACSRAVRRRTRSPSGTAPHLFFFEVTPAKHAILARGYVEDARFKAHYEKLADRDLQNGCGMSSTRMLVHTVSTLMKPPGVKSLAENTQ